jgi:hypothetical protein
VAMAYRWRTETEWRGLGCAGGGSGLFIGGLRGAGGIPPWYGSASVGARAAHSRRTGGQQPVRSGGESVARGGGGFRGVLGRVRPGEGERYLGKARNLGKHAGGARTARAGATRVGVGDVVAPVGSSATVLT